MLNGTKMPDEKLNVTGIVTWFVRVDRTKICYLHFIVESYDGIATMSTVNKQQGIVRVSIPVTRSDDALALLQKLCTDLECELITCVGNGL